MAICINKKTETVDVIDVNSSSIFNTDKYGDIAVVNEFNKEDEKYKDYTKFDTIGEYDLYINKNADNIVAVFIETIENLSENVVNDYTTFIDDIKEEFKLDDVYFDKAESAIIVKSNDLEILSKIKEKYGELFTIDDSIDGMLFLENNDSEIKLEDSPLDKLNDQDMKAVINKAGIKLNGNETKDQLKGIMQGMSAQSK